MMNDMIIIPFSFIMFMSTRSCLIFRPLPEGGLFKFVHVLGVLGFSTFLRWSSGVFPGCKDSCDLSEYYCPHEWSRHIEPP